MMIAAPRHTITVSDKTRCVNCVWFVVVVVVCSMLLKQPQSDDHLQIKSNKTTTHDEVCDHSRE